MADIDEVEQIPDPVERALEVGRRMEQIPALHTRLREIRQAAVVQMHDEQHLSYAEIGRLLGMHRNRVQQIYQGRTGGGRGSKSIAEGE